MTFFRELQRNDSLDAIFHVILYPNYVIKVDTETVEGELLVDNVSSNLKASTRFPVEPIKCFPRSCNQHCYGQGD